MSTQRHFIQLTCKAVPIAAFAGAGFFGALVNAQAVEEAVRVAQQAPLAPSSLLLDVAAAGGRFVAVGERGHVLLSDDRGLSWTQAQYVPTQALLTAVCFADEVNGIAVGHDEVILVTSDGGQRWERTHYAPEAEQPLLDVWCGSEGRAMAVGAYAAFYDSADGGRTWNARSFDAKPAHNPAGEGSAGSSTDEEFSDDELGGGYHLNRIVAASGERFYIAAEAGHLYRSDDGGATWLELPSPYEGSFFGVLPLSEREVLAYGLRGNLYRSSDAGLTWGAVETGTVAMLNDAVPLGDDAIVVIGLSGTVLVSADQGRTFALRQQEHRKGLSAALAVDRTTVLVVGEGGARLIKPAPPIEARAVTSRSAARGGQGGRRQ